MIDKNTENSKKEFNNKLKKFIGSIYSHGFNISDAHVFGVMVLFAPTKSNSEFSISYDCNELHLVETRNCFSWDEHRMYDRGKEPQQTQILIEQCNELMNGAPCFIKAKTEIKPCKLEITHMHWIIDNDKKKEEIMKEYVNESESNSDTKIVTILEYNGEPFDTLSQMEV